MEKESQIEQAILRFLNKFGFAFKVPDQRRFKSAFMVRGISDIIFIYQGSVLFVEIKKEKGRQSGYQTIFESKIRANGGTYLLWRSIDDAKEFIANYSGRSNLPSD